MHIKKRNVNSKKSNALILKLDVLLRLVFIMFCKIYFNTKMIQYFLNLDKNEKRVELCNKILKRRNCVREFEILLTC